VLAPGQLKRAKADFIHPSTAYLIMREPAPNQFSMTDSGQRRARTAQRWECEQAERTGKRIRPLSHISYST
jgi:hypothetical protein